MEDYNQYKSDYKLKRKIQIFDTIFALVIVALGIIALLNYNNFKQEVFNGISTFGFIGLFISVLLLEIIPNMLNPYLALIMGIALGLNVHLCILVAIFGTILGSNLGFLLGNKYGWKFVLPLFERKTIEKIIIWWKKYGKWFVAVSAITPLPYIPLVFGALGMHKREFALWGILVRILSFVLAGYLVYFGIVSFW